MKTLSCIEDYLKHYKFYELLLADAEVGEDVVQGVVAGDFAAGNFADGGDGVP